MRTIKLDPYGGWVFEGGQPVWVEDEDKLEQDINEILATEFSGLHQQIGESVVDPIGFSGTASLELRAALEELKTLHSTHRPDRRTAAESLGRISLVQVLPGFLAFRPASRVRYLVTVRFTSKAGTTSNSTRPIS